MSFGPIDEHHPDLHPAQIEKLNLAFDSKLLLMRGGAWMGLPAPKELRDPKRFVPETPDAEKARAQKHYETFAEITARGVGKAAFDAAGGWAATITQTDTNKFTKACAEWADGEFVASHIAYGNEILCTNDFGKNAGRSIFNTENRIWLGRQYRVIFCTLQDLALKVDYLIYNESGN